MIVIKLKEIKLAYERRLDRRCTWDEVARRTGIPKDTIAAMATRKGYNTTLRRINQICEGMNVDVSDVLEYRPPPSKKKPAKKKRKKTTKGKTKGKTKRK